MSVSRLGLGVRVRCKYTGLSGTATQRIEYLGQDVDKIGVQPDSDASNGALPNIEYVPENWLEPENKRSPGFGTNRNGTKT